MFSFFSNKKQIKEDRHFKQDYYVYVSKYFSEGHVEMWCHCTRLPDLNHHSEYFLGYFLPDKTWEKPKKAYYKLDWGINKGAERLHKVLCMQTPEPEKPKKLVENKVWTREDFVNFGKKGQRAVKEKYGKAPVKMRWEDKG